MELLFIYYGPIEDVFSIHYLFVIDLIYISYGCAMDLLATGPHRNAVTANLSQLDSRAVRDH